MIPGGADVGREHAGEVDGYGGDGPVRVGAEGGFLKEEVAGDDAEKDACCVTEGVREFFSVAISFIFHGFYNAYSLKYYSSFKRSCFSFLL